LKPTQHRRRIRFKIPFIGKRIARRAQTASIEKNIINSLFGKGRTVGAFPRPFMVRVSDALIGHGKPTFYHKLAIRQTLVKGGLSAPSKIVLIGRTPEAQTIKPLVSMLKKGKGVFLKITEGTGTQSGGIHRSESVYRLQQTHKGLLITAEEKATLARLKQNLKTGKIIASEPQSVLLQTDGSINSLRNAVATLVTKSKSLKPGAYIAEREIVEPLFNGKKWMIRSVNAMEKGERKVVSTFSWATEKGRKFTVAGHSDLHKTENLLHGLYRGIERYKNAPEPIIQTLVTKTMQQIERASNYSSRLIDHQFARDGARYLPHLPETALVSKIHAVDFIGEFNERTGLIEMKIIEAHPEFDYSRLAEIDREAHIKTKIAYEDRLGHGDIPKEWKARAGV